MDEHGQHLITMLMEVSVFLLIISVWLICILLWLTNRAKRNRQIQRRLEMTNNLTIGSGERVLRLWHEGKEAVTVVPWQRGEGIAARMQRNLTDVGVETPLPQLLASFFGLLALVMIAVYLITASLFISCAVPVGVLIVVWLILTSRIAKRQALFEAQLIDAMELAARSLRVGHPLVASFQLIAEEVPAPVGSIFAQVCQQQALGVAMQEALRSASERVASQDLRLFATSVVIQLRSGGNLADMMQRLSNIIRERNRLTRRVRVLTAQTQFSKRVLLALPFLIFLGMNLVNPAYMRTLYVTPLGQVIMLASALGMLFGWITMNYLSKLTP